MNELSHDKRAELKRMLALGLPNRAIQRALPCSHATVTRYKRMWQMSPQCACGRPAGHKEWCRVRLDFSPTRRGFLQERWGKRRESNVSQTVDRAVAVAKDLGHELGPFMWTSAQAASVALAVCKTCGKTVRVFGSDSQWERYEDWKRYAGNAVTDPCKTEAERAAERAAQKEKRSWREGRQTLKVLQSLLRRRGSTPDLSSLP